MASLSTSTSSSRSHRVCLQKKSCYFATDILFFLRVAARENGEFVLHGKRANRKAGFSSANFFFFTPRFFFLASQGAPKRFFASFHPSSPHLVNSLAKMSDSGVSSSFLKHAITLPVDASEGAES